MKQAEIYINEASRFFSIKFIILQFKMLIILQGVHPSVIADGFDIAKDIALQVLEEIKIPYTSLNRETLLNVAQTALRTKVYQNIADKLTDICVDAVLAIQVDDKPIDLYMAEIVEMQHRSEEDTCLIRGLVLDHGARHPDMKKIVRNAFILTCNCSLEYEKTTVTSGFFYKSAEERSKLVEAEKKFIDDRVKKIIELKRKVCGDDPEKSFVVINQQGIDPNSLDLLAREGIVALRRAKRRNMERLTLACGGSPMNSFEDLTPECLGFAGLVYEQVLGEEKYTFIEELKNPRSVTILIKGSNKHSLTQIKDAVYDGLRAVRNTIEDKCLIPGAGAFEIAAYTALINHVPSVNSKAQLGIKAFANSLLIIPKTLAMNSGYDPQDVIVKLSHAYNSFKQPVGVNPQSGEAFVSQDRGIYDNYRVKKQLLTSCPKIASKLLITDEIMRAGLSSLKSNQ